MPLSEHEQRQLEQIEQALYAEHPRFARQLRAADPQVHYKRRVAFAAAGFLVAGVGLLFLGIVINLIAVSVAGFIVMLACCYWAAMSYRRMNGMVTGRLPMRDRRSLRRGRRGGTGAGLGGRLEERWRRRQEGRDR